MSFVFIFVSMILMLSGCATTALKAVRDKSDALIPDSNIIQNELKQQAFEIGRIYFDLRTTHPEEDHVLPDEAYIKMLDNQLRKAFGRAQIDQGKQPVYTINVAIEEMRFTAGRFLFPKPSILRVRMEIVRPDKTQIMRGSFESRDSAAVPIFLGGILTPISVPHGTSIMGHSRLIPAMAVLITKIAVGLQQGKTLDAIEIIPDDFPIPPAGNLLAKNEWGIAPLTPLETEEITGLQLEEYEKEPGEEEKAPKRVSEKFIARIDTSSWIKESFTVSPDSRRIAYVAKVGNKQLVVVDGKKEKEYDGIMEGTLIFSPDGEHVAYGAQVDNKWLVVVDGKEEKQYDGIMTRPSSAPTVSM